MNAPTRLPLGFSESIGDSQAAFRAVLQALSRPGLVVDCNVDLPEVPGLMPATAAVLLTLTDPETAVWWGQTLPPANVAEHPGVWLSFHTGAPTVANPAAATFAVCSLEHLPISLDELALGSDVSPENSATLLLELPCWTGGPQQLWQGPGVCEPLLLDLPVREPNFWVQWAQNHERFPSGVDVLLMCGHQLMGLPRTTQVLSPKER